MERDERRTHEEQRRRVWNLVTRGEGMPGIAEGLLAGKTSSV
jgi:hypothetical protein